MSTKNTQSKRPKIQVEQLPNGQLTVPNYKECKEWMDKNKGEEVDQMYHAFYAIANHNLANVLLY